MTGVYARGAARRGARSRVRVDVNRRGRTLRVDGSHASRYVPGRVLTGSVWDALAVPLLLLAPRRRRTCLVLGLGGGSAARLLRALAPGARIVGVERDAEVLRAARRWFDLDELGIEVVQEDAQSYLAREKRRFDLVVEDLFAGRGRALSKPPWLSGAGLALAARRVAPGGVLVSNTLDETAAVVRELRRLFPVALRINVAGYDNRVVVGASGAARARALRAAVAQHPILAPSLPRLSFRSLSSPRRGTGARPG